LDMILLRRLLVDDADALDYRHFSAAACFRCSVFQRQLPDTISHTLSCHPTQAPPYWTKHLLVLAKGSP